MNKVREQGLKEKILEVGFRGMDLERILNIAGRYRITEQLINNLDGLENLTKASVWETMNELIA